MQGELGLNKYFKIGVSKASKEKYLLTPAHTIIAEFRGNLWFNPGVAEKIH